MKAGTDPAQDASVRANWCVAQPHAQSLTRREEAPSEQRLVSRAVKRAQEGDRAAIGFLYSRYADNVYGYVRSIVHDSHDAEDITQHVFAKLMHVIGKYEEREVPFFAWVLRVSRNVALDYVRRTRPVPVEEVRVSDESDDGPAGRARMSDLREALAALPREQREVLVLRHLAGLSPTEIAELTGRTEGSVHGLHHRGRRTLTADLQRRGAAPATAAMRCAGGRAVGAGGSALGAPPPPDAVKAGAPDAVTAGRAVGPV